MVALLVAVVILDGLEVVAWALAVVIVVLLVLLVWQQGRPDRGEPPE